MDNTCPQTSAIDLFQQLSIADLEARLVEEKGEEVALRTLLRSLKAKERARKRSAVDNTRREVSS